MKITIDSSVLNKYNITLEELMLLYLGAKEVNIKEILESLIAKGFADKNLFSENSIIVSDKIKDLISSIFIDSDKKVIDKDEEFIALATKMQELYPKGKKAGTNYMWRGTKTEIARKLKTLVVKYGYVINEEDILKATKEYVESFFGNYKYMPLLKYFILKTVVDADGNTDIKSELMSLTENKEQIEEQREDWISTIS